MKISVLTPSYNSGKYIDRAIQSVLVQGYPHFEHIIVDGASKDETVSILNKYPHLNWVSEPDKGQSDAMNKAFAKCTGDIVVYLNADDYFAEGAFKTILEEFAKNPSADIVVGKIDVLFEQTGVVENVSPSTEYEYIVSFFHYQFPGNPVGYFYKRAVQEKVGPFPVDNHYTMDYWFLLRAFAHAKSVKVEKTLGTFFVDGSNKSSDGDRSHKIASLTLLEYLMGLEPKERETVFLTLMDNVRNLFSENLKRKDAYQENDVLRGLLAKVHQSFLFRLYALLRKPFAK